MSLSSNVFALLSNLAAIGTEVAGEFPAVDRETARDGVDSFGNALRSAKKAGYIDSAGDGSTDLRLTAKGFAAYEAEYLPANETETEAPEASPEASETEIPEASETGPFDGEAIAEIEADNGPGPETETEANGETDPIASLGFLAIFAGADDLANLGAYRETEAPEASEALPETETEIETEGPSEADLVGEIEIEKLSEVAEILPRRPSIALARIALASLPEADRASILAEYGPDGRPVDSLADTDAIAGSVDVDSAEPAKARNKPGPKPGSKRAPSASPVATGEAVPARTLGERTVEIEGRATLIRVSTDRIVVSSPGYFEYSGPADIAGAKASIRASGRYFGARLALVYKFITLGGREVGVFETVPTAPASIPTATASDSTAS